MATVAILHNHPIHYKHLLFCELARQGMDFEVLFTASSSGARIEAPLPQNSEYLCSFGHAGPYETATAMRTACFIWRSLNRIRPAVVIITGYADAAAWTGWLWAGLHRAGKILWAESNLFDHPRHAWKELPKQVFVRNCARAHVYGESSREYIETLGMPRERIRTRRAIADTLLFLNAGEVQIEKPKAIGLLYCGRFAPEKNLPFLLRALAAAKQDAASPRLTLTLVGGGPLEESLRAQVRELGIASIVNFVGSAPQAELPRIFRSCDVLVLPSAREPWGLVVNEAMLSGLAIAVSERCGCAADLVKPETGWTFSPDNEVELTSLLTRIAGTSRNILKKMGQEGRLLASEYSARNCARDVVDMVNGLLHPTAGRAIVAGVGN